MIAVLLAVVASVASHGTVVAAEWIGISRIGLAAFGWSFFLLCFSIGCIHPLAIVLALPSLILFLGFIMTGSSVWLSIMSNGPAVSLILLLNLIVTVVLLGRLLQLHRGVIESGFYDSLNPTLYKRRIWSRERKDWSGSLNRGDRVLDSIRRPVGSDLRSQVRHFLLGFGLRVNVMALIPLLAAILWLIHFVSSQYTRGADFEKGMGLSFTIMAAVIVLTSGRKNLQWILLLPAQRKEIVSRYGTAMALRWLHVILTIETAYYIVAWMPFPGVPHHSPSIWPFVDSLTAQLPLFGIATLIAAKPHAMVQYLVAFAVMIALIAAPDLNALGLHLFLPAVFLVLGIGVIAWSYRRWLQTDIS
jgi:hypothetical protein